MHGSGIFLVGFVLLLATLLTGLVVADARQKPPFSPAPSSILHGLRIWDGDAEPRRRRHRRSPQGEYGGYGNGGYGQQQGGYGYGYGGYDNSGWGNGGGGGDVNPGGAPLG